MSKTIFISGASRGFGKTWAEAFLKRGDKVIATARNVDALSDLVQQYGEQLLPIQLNVNDREAGTAAVQQAKAHFGTIDVLINNAGFGLLGSVEEVSEQQAHQVMETNFFGLLWLTQAVLPIMRQQGHGHIIQVTSVLGLITWPVMGLYNASKFAVEGLSETLAAEVKEFGIKVSLVEPGPYATDFAGTSATYTQGLPAYDAVKAAFRAEVVNVPLGKPAATTDAILKLVDSENPPLRLLLGKLGYPLVQQAYRSRMAEWEAWNEVAIAAQGA
jgi:NAD(P)-dependent dehydrogenase (short-subunit alcohol dehydrogenase family)